MKKVIKNGLVAVLYSPGFGAGWSTWNDDQGILFDPEIVRKVEQGKQSEITECFMESIGYKNMYCGGAEDLEIEWVCEGCQFEVEEYDGSESVHIIGDRGYTTA